MYLRLARTSPTLSTSLVRVEYRLRYGIEGQGANAKSGLGLVINAQRGFVLVSRAIVPNSCCNIQVTVADSAVLPASVKCLHPWHHWAIICYGANLVRVPVKSAKLITEDISQGQKITFVGCDGRGEIVEASTSVTKIIAHGLEPLCLRTARLINIDKIEVEAALNNECNTGFPIATDATVQGVWIAPESACLDNHRFGIDSQEIAAIAVKVSQGVDISFWRLPLELQSVKITEVEAMGVSTEWINKVLDERSDRRTSTAKRTWSQMPHQFQVGDILLSLNGKLVTRPSDLNITDPEEVYDVVASREGNEITVRASSTPEHDLETTRLTTFSGLVVHKPHRTMWQFIDKLPSEIWVANIYLGSPAHWYGVPSMCFIIYLDGKPVSCITSLLSVISQIPNNKGMFCAIAFLDTTT
ncbi:Pro-apoptotic serine protease [Fusarium oxysporum f. sp. raphani]|uniref:Pro-apoptotic serine protease n=1 Tax=Fusarium oxysporum f. sp. raphani TaxID=96318 RepID=A0A8J5P9L9_FUSOX|nr:Pro-apoptotic serine protease [Fusarium oxysporum f. sp. raphani]